MPYLEPSYMTASFMRTISQKVGVSFYACNGTGMDRTKIANVLKNDFNYSTATQANFHDATIENELDYNRPVIITCDSHAWVCDGYRRIITFDVGFLTFNMNWGWGGDYDGYFASGNFKPGNKNYNNSVKMVYNIKP